MFELNKVGEIADNFTNIPVGTTSWCVSVEQPFAFIFNKKTYGVVFATPDNMVDFAVGFALSEDVIRDVSEIISLDIRMTDQGVDLDFTLADMAIERMALTPRRRNLYGAIPEDRAGLASDDILFPPLAKVSEKPVSFPIGAMHRAIGSLASKQPLYQKTRSAYAAGWVDKAGNILVAREDIYSVNALDKVLGHLAQKGQDIGEGFIIISGPCRYETVEKALRLGAKTLLTIQAPTNAAVSLAKESHMSLYARAAAGVVRVL